MTAFDTVVGIPERQSNPTVARWLRPSVQIIGLGLPAALVLAAFGLAMREASGVNELSWSLAMAGMMRIVTSLVKASVIVASTSLAVIGGLLLAWLVRTRSFFGKALFITLILIPAAMPYEAVAWSVRNAFSDVPGWLLACTTLFIRYLPLAFVFSYLAVARFGSRSLAVVRNLGISEPSFFAGVLVRQIWRPLIVQAVFLIVTISCDAIGMSSPSGGQLGNLGNLIDDWTKTTENGAVAYILALIAAAAGGFAVSVANVRAWQAGTHKLRAGAPPEADRSDGLLPWGWLVVLAAGLTVVAPGFLEISDFGAGLSAFKDGLSEFAVPTLFFLGWGAAFVSLPAFVVYDLMQSNKTDQHLRWIGIAFAITSAGILTPPVMRGNVFLLFTHRAMGLPGSVFWCALWSSAMMLPVIITIAAGHPVSCANRFKQVLRNLSIGRMDRFLLALSHARPVLLHAYLVWVFLTIFDTSIAGVICGFDRPLAVWFRNQVHTSLDPNLIGTSIVISLAAASIGLACMIAYLGHKRSAQ